MRNGFLEEDFRILNRGPSRQRGGSYAESGEVLLHGPFLESSSFERGGSGLDDNLSREVDLNSSIRFSPLGRAGRVSKTRRPSGLGIVPRQAPLDESPSVEPEGVGTERDAEDDDDDANSFTVAFDRDDSIEVLSPSGSLSPSPSNPPTKRGPGRPRHDGMPLGYRPPKKPRLPLVASPAPAEGADGGLPSPSPSPHLSARQEVQSRYGRRRQPRHGRARREEGEGEAESGIGQPIPCDPEEEEMERLLGAAEDEPLTCFLCLSCALEYSSTKVDPNIRTMVEIFYKMNSVHVSVRCMYVSKHYEDNIREPNNNEVREMIAACSTNEAALALEKKLLPPLSPKQVYWHFKLHALNAHNTLVNRNRKVGFVVRNLEKELLLRQNGEDGVKTRVNLPVVELYLKTLAVERALQGQPKDGPLTDNPLISTSVNNSHVQLINYDGTKGQGDRFVSQSNWTLSMYGSMLNQSIK